VALATRDFRACVIARRIEHVPSFCPFGALGIDEQQGRADLLPCLLTHGEIERQMNGCAQTCHPSAIDRRRRRSCSSPAGRSAGRSTGCPSTTHQKSRSTRRALPRHACARHVLRRHHRLDQRPLGVGQIAGISQAAPLRSPPVIRQPHRAPSFDSGALL
jgi:hypothetical protein